MTYSSYTYTVNTTGISSSSTNLISGPIQFTTNPTVTFSASKLRPKTALELLEDRINEVRRMVAA